MKYARSWQDLPAPQDGPKFDPQPDTGEPRWVMWAFIILLPVAVGLWLYIAWHYPIWPIEGWMR